MGCIKGYRKRESPEINRVLCVNLKKKMLSIILEQQKFEINIEENRKHNCKAFYVYVNIQMSIKAKVQ